CSVLCCVGQTVGSRALLSSFPPLCRYSPAARLVVWEGARALNGRSASSGPARQTLLRATQSGCAAALAFRVAMCNDIPDLVGMSSTLGRRGAMVRKIDSQRHS